MPVVISDIYTVYAFQELFRHMPDNFDATAFKQVHHLVENLIICEQIKVDKNGIEYYGLDKLCNQFEDVFDFFESQLLYPSYSYSLQQWQLPEGGDIAKRGEHYIKIAEKLNCYFSPHPTRYEVIGKNVRSILNCSAKEIINSFDNQILSSDSGNIANIDITVPPLVEHVFYFARKNGLPIITAINEIRRSKNAIKFREYCNSLDLELRELTPRKKATIYNKLFKDINRVCLEWAEDLDNGVKYRKRNINLVKIPLFGKLFEVAGIKEIAVNDPILFNTDTHLFFLNDLYRP